MYQLVSNAFAVFATFGGSQRLPAWYRNVEREYIWDGQVRQMPAFADVEIAARRRTPVLVLDPVRGAPRVAAPREAR